jgi:hypothetical protein
MKDHISYIHVYDSQVNRRMTEAILFSRFPYLDDMKDVTQRVIQAHNYHRGFGGFTVRVDHARGTMVVALCSFKDQYSRKLGKQRTDARAKILAPVPFLVIIPRVHEESTMFFLQQYAAYECFRLWMDFGWPIEQFRINLCI